MPCFFAAIRSRCGAGCGADKVTAVTSAGRMMSDREVKMRKIMSVSMVFAFVLCATAQEKPTERINVYLTGSCNDNATGAVVESSLRDSIRASSGYALVDVQSPGNFLIALACVDAG